MIAEQNPIYSLSSTQLELRDVAAKFSREVLLPAAAEATEKQHDVPAALIRQMADLGFVGLDIPEEYGGAGFDTLTSAVICEELAGAWFAASSYATILGASPILYAGSDEQKRRFLPALTSGDMITAFALTEPDGGSDAASISTSAERQVDGYVINGTKMFITNAHRADFLVVFARTDKNAPRGSGISLFLVEKGTPGFLIGQKFRMLAHEANPICEVVFDHCRVPLVNRLGDEGGAFSYIQKDFARVRAIYAARCVGVAQWAMDYALQYASERVQFGKPISSYQGIRFGVADVITKIEAARQLTYRSCAMCDAASPDAAVAVSMSKHFAADVCAEAVSYALQLMGGHGFIKDHPLERYYREAKLFQIGDGSSEMLRILISRFANKKSASRSGARL